MPGKKNIRFINSLKQKKFRQKHQLFIVEGEKLVDELIKSSYRIHSLYATASWFSRQGSVRDFPGRAGDYPVYEVTGDELERISGLTTPNKVVAAAHTSPFPLNPASLKGSLSLVLDHIQDPGNLGTLIRTADWFGIRDIILSHGSAEITSPKVIQATMGSVFRIRSYYADLPSLLGCPELAGMPVYGAFPGVPSIYSVTLDSKGFILLGNESRGISAAAAKFVTRAVSIPSFPPGGSHAESLNVAVAGSIIMSEFRRRQDAGLLEMK